MRYCPFCSGENAVGAVRCVVCGRSLPSAPARRTAEAAAVPSPSAAPSAATAPLVAPPHAATVPTALPAPARRSPSSPPPIPGSIGAAVQAATGEAPALARRSPSVPPLLAALRRTASAPPAGALPTGPGRRREDQVAPALGEARARTPSTPPAMPTSPEWSAGVARDRLDAPALSLPMAPSPSPDSEAPPPTLNVYTVGYVDRPYAPSTVVASWPEAPERGLVATAAWPRCGSSRARWQCRGAVRQLGEEIRRDTTASTRCSAASGAPPRAAGLETKALSVEKPASATPRARAILAREVGELAARAAPRRSSGSPRSSRSGWRRSPPSRPPSPSTSAS
ncbi:MAG: hypothetical protein R2939_15095 [Kofleriaceae bacterium]